MYMYLFININLITYNAIICKICILQHILYIDVNICWVYIYVYIDYIVQSTMYQI